MNNAKLFLSKALANNPVNRLFFFLFGKRISFNHLTIRVISTVLKQRIPFHNITIDVSDETITPMTKALLYWGNYEKKEVSFVQKYLDCDDDVIELGSSIGVMGSIISQLQSTGRYISVEADPALVNANKKNIALNRTSDYILLNKAVDYFNKTVSFSTSKSTLTGKIERDGSNSSTVTIETITLDEICTLYKLDNYTLVSDIEGAEITILINDEAALKKCKKMVIEFHGTEYNGKYYSIQDMANIVISYNFKLVDQDGPVFVFEKNDQLLN